MTRLKIQDFLAAGKFKSKDVERFIDEQEAIPIVENGSVTFLFRGRAKAVNLRHWIYGLDSTSAFQQIEGSKLWHLTVQLPPSSRIEYKIEVSDGEGWALVPDQFNPHLAADPFGANSVLHCKGYEVPEWVEEHESSRKGTIEEIEVPSAILGGPRPVLIYKPARFRPNKRYPLLIMHDGADYLRFSSAKNVFDNLIHRLELAPMIVAMTIPFDRLGEYGANPKHADHLVNELLPWLNENLPVIDRPEARGIMGASFGAVSALYTAWKYPGTFGKLLVQSGSFAFSDIGHHGRPPVFDEVAKFVNAFRENPGKPVDQIFVSCGVYESLIYENRSLVPLLERSGIKLRYVESRDGHNWENWRDRLRESLSWLFPGPLWMVYE